MKALIEIANQLHALDLKMAKEPNVAAYTRHLSRIRSLLAEEGIVYHSPEGEKYADTRTDIEATITGQATENLTIGQVIKPIVMFNNQIVQTGIVIVS